MPFRFQTNISLIKLQSDSGHPLSHLEKGLDDNSPGHSSSGVQGERKGRRFPVLPRWEGTATSLWVSLSTSSVKLEIKPGPVSFDNSHPKSQTQTLQGPESTQATRKALPPCLSSPLPWANTPCRLGPRVAAPTGQESPNPAQTAGALRSSLSRASTPAGVSRPFLLSLRASPRAPCLDIGDPLTCLHPAVLGAPGSPRPSSSPTSQQ